MSESKLFYLTLIGLSNAHKNYCMQKFYSLNLSTGQPKILSILLENEGYLQKDLAKRAHVEPATITSILKNMMDKKLIFKQQRMVSGGKRAYAIYLTELGRNIACEVKQVTDEAEQICFEGMTKEEKEAFMKQFKKIYHNIEQALSHLNEDNFEI